MKLYCVFGVEYHIGETLLGIYDTREKAELRVVTVDPFGYDKIDIKEIVLNSDIE